MPLAGGRREFGWLGYAVAAARIRTLPHQIARSYPRRRTELWAAFDARQIAWSGAARLLKRSQAYVSRKEDGARALSVVELLQFARIYGTTPRELLRPLERHEQERYAELLEIERQYGP